jgi:hypothetical protein
MVARFIPAGKNHRRPESRRHLVVRRPTYALSLKQPWAALVVGGRKTIEVRNWATAVRGKFYVHAARIPDERPEVWALLPDDLKPLAELAGGLIGSAELSACVMYRTAAGFAADAPKHLNSPDWFEPPRMYGFHLRAATPLPFFPCKGNVRFFTVNVPATA